MGYSALIWYVTALRRGDGLKSPSFSPLPNRALPVHRSAYFDNLVGAGESVTRTSELSQLHLNEPAHRQSGLALRSVQGTCFRRQPHRMPRL
jgi:hypothetical protein